MHILANFVIFDDFGHFNRKMNILDLFWGPQPASSPKVTIYLPLAPWTLSGPVKTLSKPYFWPLFWPFWGSGERLWILDPTKWHFSSWYKWHRNRCKYAQNLLQPFKSCLVQIEIQNHHFTFDTLFLDPYFWPQNKMLICSALIGGPQNRPQNPKMDL